MLILSKYKDYYDYLVGIYGLDKDIVFDRKEAVLLSESNEWIPINRTQYIHLSTLFNKEDKTYAHKKEKLRRFWKYQYIDFSQPVGDNYFFILEIGRKQYTFQVERYLDGNGKLCLDHKLLKAEQSSQKKCKSIIGIILCEISYINDLRVRKVLNYPFILKDTWITKYISAEEAYNEIYNYLISVRDKEITDSRTDVQKAESHGFNKESFRNPIRIKDLK